MTGLVAIAAVISSLSLDGSIAADHMGDYVVVPFEVPAGTREIQVQHRSVSSSNVLDWGLWDGQGWRGWGGGLVDDAVVGETAASRGYIPGAITAGTWYLVIGKASIDEVPAAYQVTVTFRDAATLTARDRAAHAGTSLETGPRWYRGDFHVHSRESGDATASFAEIRTLAVSQRLDFVVLSDHNTVSQHGLIAALQPTVSDLLFVRGAEVTTYGGHANAFGISEYVDHRIGLDGRTAAAMIGDITAQGGLVSINHPALDLGQACIGCAWSHSDTPWEEVDAVEIQTGRWESTVGVFTPLAMALWDEQLDAGHRLAALGGSDDHRAGQDTGVNGTPIGAPTTMVYADELSESAILAGVAAGRTVVLLRGPDSPVVELFIEAGAERGMIGDSVAGSRVVVEAHVTGGAGLDLQLVRNGEPDAIVSLASDDVTERFELDVAAGGERYRVEVLDQFLPVTVTSHVYADYVPGGDEGGCCQSSREPRSDLVVLGLLVWLGLLVITRRRRSRI
jgi:hypothetical protein